MATMEIFMKKAQDVTGGSLGEVPNEHYRKFFNKFKEIETLDVKEWKVVHLISYFCKKYKEHFNLDYKFKYNNSAPSKAHESFIIRKISVSLSSNPQIFKDYIDWVFLTKVVKAKRRITSISFLSVEDIMNDYKINVLLKNDKRPTNIDRSIQLPKEYKLIFAEAGYNLENYGDLAFMSQASEMPENFIKAFDRIKEMGFDLSLLEKVV